MPTPFSPLAHARSVRQGGASLTWILFPSVLFVMVVAFITVQALGIFPDAVPLSFKERMDLDRLAQEATEDLTPVLLITGLMTAGILMALRLGLRPLRQISERAASIGPATISQRLPLKSAPREIAPLVIAFNAALDRLEAGWRAQREFSANAAHELRTPLAALRAQVESVLGPEERKDAIEQFERLARLVTQLLILAEADSGEDLGSAPFDLVALARDVTSDMAGAILASGRDVGFESSPERWQRYGSPDLIEAALRNLIENAMRHTPRGSEVLVSIDAHGRLVVSDNGPGVPPAFHDRLFQRFSKADAQGPGAGLGLSIVRRVMTLHGGEARLEPSPAGARFVLDFDAQGFGRDTHA